MSNKIATRSQSNRIPLSNLALHLFPSFDLCLSKWGKMCIEKGILFQYLIESVILEWEGTLRYPLFNTLFMTFTGRTMTHHQGPLRSNLMPTLPLTMCLPNTRLENTSKC